MVGVTILAHSIIPHDHHTELSNYQEHNHQKNGQEPIHCHFLNHIDIDKVSTNNSYKIIKQFPGLLAIIKTDNTKLYIDLFVKVTGFLPVSLNLKNIIYSISPTRGSPLSFL